MPTHGVICDNCGEETYSFEKYCHICGYNRWDGKMPESHDHPVE